jgi:hypothetical protein
MAHMGRALHHGGSVATRHSALPEAAAIAGMLWDMVLRDGLASWLMWTLAVGIELRLCFRRTANCG